MFIKMTITLYLTEVYDFILMGAVDAVQLLFGLHGQIFVHRTRLLRTCRLLEGVDLLLGQIESPAPLLH